MFFVVVVLLLLLGMLKEKREVGGEAAPGIGSNSHPLTPLAALAALTHDRGMCLSIGQCVDVLWNSKDDTLAQIFA